VVHDGCAGAGSLVDHGVHAFVVPLRDDAGRCLPGVEIHDCGYKVRQSSQPQLEAGTEQQPADLQCHVHSMFELYWMYCL
jgi:hypothetical protein